MRNSLRRIGGSFFACLFSCLLFAQPDLVRSDFWQNGDVFQYFGINASNLSAGDAGNGVTWDFSTLVRIQSEDGTFTYISPADAPNAASFPNANSVQKVDANVGTVIYQFYSITNDGVIEEGQETPAGTVILSDKRQLATFPVRFNQMQSDTFAGTFTIDFEGMQATVTRNGTFESVYDGFGTLKLGDKTYTNVKRLKSTQVVDDTISLGSGIGFTNTTTTVSYAYIGTVSRSPLFNYTEATSNNFGNITSSKSATMLNLGDVVSAPSGRYGAHLTSQGGSFNTEVIIRNPTDQAQVLTLNPLGSDGAALAPVTVNLPANGTERMLQENYFPSDAVSFNVSGCNSCIFTTGYRADLPDGSTAHVPQATDFRTEYYFYPGEWDLLFDGAALINTGSGPAKIDASQIADDGTVLQTVTLADALPAGGKYLDVFNTKFTNNPNAIVKLTSSQPLAVMILRISQDFRYLYQNLALPANPGSSDARWLAHITSDTGGFGTSILVHNQGDLPGVVTLQPYNASGDALTPVPVAVEAGKVRRFQKSELLPSEASHASISGSSDVVVSLGYQSTQPNSSTAQIHEAAPIGNVFYIYPGEWDYLFDGLALINVGNKEASITATQIRDDGSTVGNISLNAALPPNAKYLAVLEGMLAPNPNAIIKIESTEPMAILALRLSKDSRFLYGNSPLQP